MTGELQYRTYAGADLPKVFDYLESLGEPLPNPALSIAFTAETTDGEIVAISIVQSLPIVEPFHAEPGHGDALGPLFQHTVEWLLASGAPRVWAHTSHRAMSRMLTGLCGPDARIEDEVYDLRREQLLGGGGGRMPCAAETQPRLTEVSN